MAKYESAYRGVLVLPDGREIAPGDTIDLSRADLDNSGVAEWVESGWLVKSGKGAASPTDDKG